MATDNLKILAGVGAGGSGGSLAWFAAGDTAGPVGVAGTDGVQTVTITGAPTGGTFTLTWDGKTTASIAYNATSTAVQTALNALAGGASITVTGGPGPGAAFVATFPKLIRQVLMTATGAFTGGSSPAVSVANTTPGVQTTNGATAAIPAAFKDAGWCDQSGLVAKVNENQNEIKGYGTIVPLRVLISESKRDFEVTFLETNATSIAVYNRQAIGSISPDSSGFFTQSIGAPVIQTYAGVFDVIDGLNHLRVYCPRLQVTSIKDRTVSPGKEISYGVGFTAFPDINGNAIYEYYAVNALAV
jgi:hypothetical protein